MQMILAKPVPLWGTTQRPALAYALVEAGMHADDGTKLVVHLTSACPVHLKKLSDLPYNMRYGPRCLHSSSCVMDVRHLGICRSEPCVGLKKEEVLIFMFCSNFHNKW